MSNTNSSEAKTCVLFILPLMPAVLVRRIVCLDMLCSLAGLVDGSRIRFSVACKIANGRPGLMSFLPFQAQAPVNAIIPGNAHMFSAKQQLGCVSACY